MTLMQLLANRGGVPGGRPLVAYRLTKAEVEAIRAELAAPCATFDSEWGALFCLFAAEHIRRTYEGGPWRWAPILEAIAFPVDRYALLYRSIERGLRRLQRELIQGPHGDRQFWLTLLCECGLPGKVIERDEARLTRFLRALLAEREQYAHAPLDGAAQRLARAYLPRSLQNATFLGVAGELVEAVRGIRSAFGEGRVTLETLDAKVPAWRDRLPFDVGDAAARRLIEGLLTSVRVEEPGRTELSLETFLLLAEHGDAHLERGLRPVGDVDLEACLGRADLPGRLGVQLLGGGEGDERPTVGVLERRSGGRYALRTTAKIRIAPPAHTPVQLSRGSERVAFESLPGSEPLGDGVWVFLPSSDHAATWVASGSYRTCAEALWVAAPAGRDLEIDPGARVAELAQFAGRALLELRGTARWRHDGKCSVLSTLDQGRARTFALRGAVADTPFLDRAALRGPPTIVEVVDDGAVVEVPRGRVEALHPGAGERWRSLDGLAGRVRLRVIEGEEVLFTTSCDIIPLDIRFELRPLREQGVGELRVTSNDVREVFARASIGVTSEVSRDGTTHVLTLRSTGPRAPVTVLLRFRCGGVIECRIPPPGRLLAFTDRHAVPIEPGTAVSAYALSGLHARYAAPPGGRAPVLDVEATLRGARPELIGRLAPTDDGTQAVHLEALRDRIELLFASIRPGDGGPRREAEAMRLSLSERGGRAADRHDLELRRDDAQFEPEKHDDHQILRLVTAGNAFGDFRELRVEATPVWDPAAAPEPLEPIGDARFRFPYAGRRPGPWLVTGWLGSTMPMRALLVTVPGDPAAHVSHRSLAWAVCLHDHEARAREMKRIFDRLARAWSDPEWAEVDAYLEKLGVYPAHTFDVVRALVDHPEALAVALLRAHDPSELERRARHLELLPMAWCLVPLRAWLQAGIAAREEAVRQSEACTNAGIEGFGVKRCVEDLLRPTVGAAHPEILPCVREVWPLVCADFPSSGPGPLLERAQRDGLVQAVAPGLLEQLRQRHPGERWPQLHLEDATSCWNDVKRMQDQFAATHIADFQRDVVRAPVLAARLLLDDTHVARDRPELLRAIRRARAFDQAWFDDTQALALAFLLGERLEHNADYLDTLAGI